MANWNEILLYRRRYKEILEKNLENVKLVKVNNIPTVARNIFEDIEIINKYEGGEENDKKIIAENLLVNDILDIMNPYELSDDDIVEILRNVSKEVWGTSNLTELSIDKSNELIDQISNYLNNFTKLYIITRDILTEK